MTVGRRDVSPCSVTVRRRDVLCINSIHTGNTCQATYFLCVQHLSIYIMDDISS